MESFHWNKNYMTGLSDVDHQHQYLVKITNQFADLLAEDKVVPNDVEELFKELASYTQYHFQEEETLMLQSGIDQRHLEQHIETHNNFLHEISNMHDKVTENGLDSAKQLLDFLIHWLAYHILGSDQNMARQISAIKSGVSAEDAYETEEKNSASATEPLLVALNALFKQVSTRNKELVKLNQSLEEKVQQRTKQLSEANQYLKELSLTDVLTGLPNRRHAMRCLSAYWEESTQTDSPLACMMIDADHFKAVNDTYGHDAGDVVLVELSTALQNAFRNDDTVCRLGGDEFFVICPNTDKEGGMHIAEIARKAVAELRVPTGGVPWHGSVSIGVACRTAEIKTYEELLKVADKGVYSAKEAGKNCVKTIS